MAYTQIRSERRGRVGWITLDRPQFRNAQSRVLLEELDDAGALTFEGYGFFEVGLLVMTNQLGKLADAALTPSRLSREEKIALMKERLRAL